MVCPSAPQKASSMKTEIGLLCCQPHTVQPGAEDGGGDSEHSPVVAGALALLYLLSCEKKWPLQKAVCLLGG